MTMRHGIPHFDGTAPNVVSKQCDGFARVMAEGEKEVV